MKYGNCDNCGIEYEADTRNLNRGWGLCCSKSCAASKREKSKPSYNPERVKANNIRRDNWNVPRELTREQIEDMEHPFSSEALGQDL